MTKSSDVWMNSIDMPEIFSDSASRTRFTSPCPQETSRNPSKKRIFQKLLKEAITDISNSPNSQIVDAIKNSTTPKVFRVSAIQKIEEKPQIIVSKYKRYREEKAAELATCFLSFSESMNCFKLVQLMYLVERESIIQDAYPVIHDDCYSFDGGVLLSKTWENIQGNTYESQPSSIWNNYIGISGEMLFSRKPFKLKKMSRAEHTLARRIFDEHGQKSLDNLKSWICDPNNLPERKPTNGFPMPISLASILRHANYSEQDIREILEEIELHQSARARFGV